MESNDRNDALIRANMESFAAAIDAGRARVDDTEVVDSVVAVLDGSDQDTTTCALVRELAHERKLAVTWTCAAPHDDEEALLRGAQDALDGLASRAVLSGRDTHHERVLEVLESTTREHDSTWLLLPCPFAHAFEQLSHTTLSTTVEVCLTQGYTPTLLTRGPLGDAAREPLVRPHLIVREFDHAAARAARAALALLRRGSELRGRLTVSFVYGGRPDPDVDDAVARGFGLSIGALMPLLGHGLSALLHRLDLMIAQHDGLELEARLVHPGGELVDEDQERGFLHVVPCRPSATGVPESVHEFVLTTEDPVLVVPAERDLAGEKPAR